MTPAPDLADAAKALVAKLRAVHDALLPIYLSAFVHGVKYDGPTWTEEVANVEAALAALSRGEGAGLTAEQREFYEAARELETATREERDLDARWPVPKEGFDAWRDAKLKSLNRLYEARRVHAAAYDAMLRAEAFAADMRAASPSPRATTTVEKPLP